MSFNFQSGRKMMMGLVAAGLLGATALSSSFLYNPPSLVRAEAVQTQTINPMNGFADLVDRVMPAVISVEVKFANASDNGSRRDGNEGMPPGMREFFEQFPQFRDRMPPNFRFRGPRGPEGTGLGSGFIISADGYAVTNNHVVKDADRVSIRTKDGEEFEAKVVGTDPKTDLALIKIDATRTFQFVNFAKNEARVGDWVMAVGNPFGLGGTVTTGIVSARGRDIGNGPYDDFLQIDASINKGNSGGPAFNLSGEVIGVNTAIFSPSGGSVGIGFAIPASTTQDVIASLRDNGQVTRGWLGVQIQPVTKDIAESLGLKEAKGAIVSDVTAGSPALAAGLKTGDTILKAGGEDIADSRDLARKVARLAPGKPVDFEIVRDGKLMTVSVKIGKMPGEQANVGPAPDEREPTSLADLGLQLAPADDGAGARITEVDPDSAAAELGLKAGDVIVSVGGMEVSGPADVRDAVTKAGKSKVLMLVRSGDGQRFLTLPLKKG
jgi:serine protease Do